MIRNVPDDLVIRADARRMVQVVRNVVNNALAHAESRVEVSAARVGDRVEIRVADDGPGVPPEHVERIFDRFYRVDESRSRTTGGAGLGLAIARELVELHGGRIWYEGGEFVMSEQIPRAQSKAIVLRPRLGDLLIFTTNFRPVKGSRGYYRVAMKHGVSEVSSGERNTLGIIFHDAKS